MKEQIRAELVRFGRRRTVIFIGVAGLFYAAVGTWAMFATATEVAPPEVRRAVTFGLLESPGGGTETFALASTFLSPFVLVTFAALFASEFSNGTMRSLLMRNPNRSSVLVGKLLGILLVASGAVAFVELASFALSLALAPTYDISTQAWFGLDSLEAAATNYLKVVAAVGGFAVFGATLAVLLRSVPLAIGVGIVWTGPFENIVVDSWNGGYRYFPGQILSAIEQGGTVDLTMGRALFTASVYVLAAGGIALATINRRDVTS